MSELPGNITIPADPEEFVMWAYHQRGGLQLMADRMRYYETRAKITPIQIKWSCKDSHEHSTEWEAQQCILLHDAIQLLKETDGVDPWLPEEFLYWHGTRLEITQKWDAAQQTLAAELLTARASSSSVEQSQPAEA